MMASLRARFLQRMFALLYTRLAGLHELAGWAAFGDAWQARRAYVLPPESGGLLLDLGCGEGRLLKIADERGQYSIGLEPARAMVSRANRRGCQVVCGRGQAMPFQSSTFTYVTATYPGPWILDAATWNEVGRVTRPGGVVCVLLGGLSARGRRINLRWLLQRAAYGRQQNGRSMTDLPKLGSSQVVGAYERAPDVWGEALLWRGRRIG
jgi:SAM-dependent methyltransferase